MVDINDAGANGDSRHHEYCYKEFTRKKKALLLSAEKKDTPRYSRDGNFKTVIDYIEEKIL